MKRISIKAKILDSLKPVLNTSTFVLIDKDKIKNLAEKLKNYSLSAWDNEMQFLGNPEQTVQYYFFVDSINFCFWREKDKERWQFLKNREWVNGYYAYSYAIKKAFLKNSKGKFIIVTLVVEQNDDNIKAILKKYIKTKAKIYPNVIFLYYLL